MFNIYFSFQDSYRMSFISVESYTITDDSHILYKLSWRCKNSLTINFNYNKLIADSIRHISNQCFMCLNKPLKTIYILHNYIHFHHTRAEVRTALINKSYYFSLIRNKTPDTYLSNSQYNSHDNQELAQQKDSLA